MDTTEAQIAWLEANGYTVTPPRDRQAEFELAVAMMLDSFVTSVQMPIKRGKAEMRDRSRRTLTIIHEEIGRMLARADARKVAAE